MTAGQPLRVLIVDDEAPARNRIRDLLSDCALKMPIEIAGEAENGKRALAMLPECEADVVLLDVRMPEMDGLEVAQHIQKLDEPPTVIFTTAYDALRAEGVRSARGRLPAEADPSRAAVRCVIARETITPLRLDVLRELKPEARTHLSVNERGRIHLIPVADIAFLKAELKYVTVRTTEREYLIEESLAKLEQEFLGRFVRVHRNCLVAKEAIRGFERATGDDGEGNWLVVMKNIAEKLAVSRRQQHIVREFGKIL